MKWHPSAQQTTSAPAVQTKSTMDFLHQDPVIASLLPAIDRIMTLQQQCATILPALFQTCHVIQLRAGQLTLGAPNTAFAARLKQQLPTLQNRLLGYGWQVNAIRVKVQVKQHINASIAPRPARCLPASAIAAFEQLYEQLENNPRNQALRKAVAAILER